MVESENTIEKYIEDIERKFQAIDAARTNLRKMTDQFSMDGLKALQNKCDVLRRKIVDLEEQIEGAEQNAKDAKAIIKKAKVDFESSTDQEVEDVAVTALKVPIEEQGQVISASYQAATEFNEKLIEKQAELSILEGQLEAFSAADDQQIIQSIESEYTTLKRDLKTLKRLKDDKANRL